MNRPARLLSLTTLVLALAAFAPNDAALKTAHFAIEGAFCSGCVGALTESVEALDGVERVQVDAQDRWVLVTFDDRATTAAAVLAHVREETSFRLVLREVRAASAPCC